MIRFTGENAEPYVLPTDTGTPKTIWWLNILTNEQVAVMEAAAEKVRQAARQANLDTLSEDVTKRAVQCELKLLAAAVAKIEHAVEPDDIITDPAAIEGLLGRLPNASYVFLRATLFGQGLMRPFALSASDSPPEPPPS